jgi:hypothetical protein
VVSLQALSKASQLSYRIHPAQYPVYHTSVTHFYSLSGSAQNLVLAGLGLGLGWPAEAEWPLFVMAEIRGGCITGMAFMAKDPRYYIVFENIA